MGFFNSDLLIEYLGLFFVSILIFYFSRYIAIRLHNNIFRQGFFGDSSVHFALVEQFKNKFFSKKIEKYVIPNPMWYPVLFHKFCTLFSLSLVRRKPFFPNHILFVLLSALFIVYTHYIGKTIFLLQDYKFTTGVIVFYLFTVSNFLFEEAEIAYLKLSERMLARMLAAFYYLTMFIYIRYNNDLSFYLAIASCGLLFTASFFGRQLILVSAIFLSIFLFDFRPLLIMGLGFAFAVLTGGPYFVKSFITNIKSWGMYFTHYNADKWDKKRRFFYRFVSLKNRGLYIFLSDLLSKEPTRTLFRMAELAGVIVLSVYFWDYKIFSFILVGLLVYFITTTKLLDVFGEGYRYLEYAFYFLSPFLLGAFLYKTSNQVFVLLLIQYVTIQSFIIFFLNYRRFKKRKVFTTDTLSNFLNQLKLPDNCVVFPGNMRLGADISARGKYNSFWWQPGGIADPVLYKEYIEEYPFLRSDFKDLFKKHNVTFALLDKNDKKISYNFSEYPVILENDQYIAFKIN
ncbi:MAG: hypothetical protein IAF38_15975 [Bacteroidia bacterium]|nr:hypothetical protein [Bacteroidia bacterium]